MSDTIERTDAPVVETRRSAALAGIARARLEESPAEAADLALKAVESARAEGDQRGAAIGMLVLSLACHESGHQPEEVLRPVMFAIDQFAALRDIPHLAEARLLRATLLYDQCAYHSAEFEAASARELAVECGDRHLIALCDVRLASILLESGGPDRTAYGQQLANAATTLLELGDRTSAARALFNVAANALEHDPRITVGASGQALSLVDDHSPIKPDLHLVRAEAAARLGWHNVADAELADFDALARRDGQSPSDNLIFLSVRGVIHASKDELDESEAFWRSCLERAVEREDHFFVLHAHGALSELHERQGDLELALVSSKARYAALENLNAYQAQRRREMFDLSGRLEDERKRAEQIRAEQHEMQRKIEAAAEGLAQAERQLELERSRRSLVELRSARDPGIEPRTGLPSLAAIAGGVTKLLDELRRVAVVIVTVDDDRVAAPLPNDRQRLLQEMSARAHAFLKRIDGAFAGSLGSEDIVGIFPIDEGIVITELLEDFHRQLVRPVDLIERTVAVNVQLGVAVAPDDGIRANGLLSRARLAAQTARQSRPYGAPIAMFEQAVEDSQQLRIFVHERLGRAVDAGHIEVLFQPKVDSWTHAAIGAEALVRWTDPARGPISPAVFIPYAEETGHIIELGGHVLTRACCDAAAWPVVNGQRTKLSVNVSASQFTDGILIAQVEAALLVSGLAPDQLALELTESALARTAEVTPVLTDLRARGITIEIDDFGTGYSSFGYLTRFPVDCVKIDKSFVDRVAMSPDDAAITQAIITMAHSLRLSVVAEGVETEEQAAVLRDQGCDSLQGWLFAKAMSQSDFVSRLHAWSVADRRPQA